MHVFLETIFRCSLIITQVTTEGFLPGVDSSVPGQFRFIC